MPRKSVIKKADRPDMTIDIYRGRKTATQQLLLKEKNLLPGKQVISYKESNNCRGSSEGLSISLNVYGYTSMKSLHFYERKPFVTSCLHSWTMQPFQNRLYSLRKKICSEGEYCFL